jgi:tryptophanyl-tRNA synthetase
MKESVLSGIKSTGFLHLGNLFGAVLNWVKIQDQYQCHYMIADLHALTGAETEYQMINTYRKDIIINLLAFGIDPAKSILFVQSEVPEHSQLHLILSMITPIPWLERNPTYKDQILALNNKDLNNYGFLGYPVLQAADIVLYKATKVPVGEDQLPHVELSR